MLTLIRTARTAVVSAMVLAAVAPATAAHAAVERTSRPRPVTVVGDGTRASVDHATIHAGRVTFVVRSTQPSDDTSNGSSISMFQPRAGHTVEQVEADLGEEASPDSAAQGTRDLVRDARFYGLADVSSARGARVTRTMKPGTYYLLDLGTTPSGPPPVTTLTVKRHGGYRAAADRVHPRATVRMTTSDRFRVSGRMPAHGTIKVKDVSDTLHFLAFARVKPGTTDRQVQAFFDSGAQGQPDWALPGPSMGTDVLSPGQTLDLTYRLHRGTYVLLCFIADDQTGMPHAFMGMHKVVRLR